jgi:CheY-like chemotaxis protein
VLRILIVEDEVLVAFALREGLEDLGASVTLAHSAAEATRALSASHFSAAVVDMLLPDTNGQPFNGEPSNGEPSNGEPFVKLCRQQCPSMPILVTTGLHAEQIRSMFPHDLLLEVLEKPHETVQVQAALERLGLVFAAPASTAP